MKSRGSGITFWWVASVLLVAGVEWLLFDLALRVGRPFLWAWVFPLFVFPACIVGGIRGILRTKSRRQRLLALKYLVGYLPWIGIPIAAQTYAVGPLYFWAWAVALRFRPWCRFGFRGE